MLASSVFFILFLLVSASRENSVRKPPSFPSLLTVKEILAGAGYEETDIEVLTEDGYSLWMHRIGNNTGQPIILQHGLFVASESWITRGPQKDLAFYLLEEGFDVWLTNQRGTVYNQYSLKYNRTDPRFWDFSFHEAGMYDLPAFIDNILQLTGYKQLIYIGHSLGTTIFLAMASMRPEYNSKIKLAILLSPIAFSHGTFEHSPIKKHIFPLTEKIYSKLIKAGMYEFLPRSLLSIEMAKLFCGYKSWTQTFCLDIYGLFLGEYRTNIDKKDFGFHMGYVPGGTSTKTVLHCIQLYETDEFKQFDYGDMGNLIKYNSSDPPSYQLNLVTTPVALYWSYNDPLLSEKSVNHLAKNLPQLIFSKPVSDPLFTHSDMYLGTNANKILYPDIINLLKTYL